MPKICGQLLGRHERRQDQEHEPALVAVAAPGARAAARGRCWNTRLQLVKTGWYWVRVANARAMLSSEAGRRTEKMCGAPVDLGDGVREQPFGAAALAELVVDLDPVPDEVAGRGRALVGERDGVEALRRGGQQRHAADDRGDRDMAVERALGVAARSAAGRSCG